jgi:hypothetical protein
MHREMVCELFEGMQNVSGGFARRPVKWRIFTCQYYFKKYKGKTHDITCAVTENMLLTVLSSNSIVYFPFRQKK